MAKKTYDDDDGRTVADMSDLYVRTPLGYRRLGDKKKAVQKEKTEPVAGNERRGYIWGALSAALLIALAFIVGIGLIILLIVLVF